MNEVTYDVTELIKGGTRQNAVFKVAQKRLAVLSQGLVIVSNVVCQTH